MPKSPQQPRTMRTTHILIAAAVILTGCKKEKTAAAKQDPNDLPWKKERTVIVGPNTTRKDVARLDPVGRVIDKTLDNIDPSGKNWSNLERRFSYDLNDDKKLDLVVLISGKTWCPERKCTMLIMTPPPEDVNQEPQLVARITTGDGPLMMAESKHSGWHDLLTTAPERSDRNFVRWIFNGKTYTRSTDPVDMKSLGAGIIVFENAGTAPDPPNSMPYVSGVKYQIDPKSLPTPAKGPNPTVPAGKINIPPPGPTRR